MNGSTLINESLMALRKSDTVAAARSFMAEQGVTDLPILDKTGLYNYARTIILLDADPNAKLEDVIPFNPHAPRIFGHQHLYEIIPVFAASDLQVLAVVSENNEFLGIVDQRNIHKQICTSLTYRGTGAIVVIKCAERDFVPSQITRMVEENGAKVLGMMTENADGSNLMISLKLNTISVKHILATFNRFNYRVEACYLAEDYNTGAEKEFDSVLRFFDL